ncbi:hypothetical protein ABK040_013326 [Willaertia magna]
MSTTHKIHYFNIQARLEAALLIAKQGNLSLEFVGHNNFQNTELKEQAPFGQLPLLEIINNETNQTTLLSQSIAICRYLAKQCNLIPTENTILESIADSYVLGIDEFRTECYRLHRFSTDENKVNNMNEWKEGRMLFYLNRFERFLKENKQSNEETEKPLVLVGESLSWVDIILYDAIYEQMFLMKDEIWSTLPLLKKFMNQIENLPNLKDYIQSKDRMPLYLPKWRNL